MNLTFYVIINKDLQFSLDAEVEAGFPFKNKKSLTTRSGFFTMDHL
jgi:hypothetical protein